MMPQKSVYKDVYQKVFPTFIDCKHLGQDQIFGKNVNNSLGLKR